MAFNLDDVVAFLQASADLLPAFNLLPVQGVGEFAGDEIFIIYLDIEGYRAGQVITGARGGAGDLCLLVGAQV